MRTQQIIGAAVLTLSLGATVANSPGADTFSEVVEVTLRPGESAVITYDILVPESNNVGEIWVKAQIKTRATLNGDIESEFETVPLEVQLATGPYRDLWDARIEVPFPEDWDGSGVVEFSAALTVEHTEAEAVDLEVEWIASVLWGDLEPVVTIQVDVQ